MPPRFVEVVDVTAEASSTVATLLAQGKTLLEGLEFDVSKYMGENATSMMAAALAEYNLTLDAVPTEWRSKLNLTVTSEYAPEGRARQYILAGICLILLREVVIAWQVRRMLKWYGMHSNAHSNSHTNSHSE